MLKARAVSSLIQVQRATLPTVTDIRDRDTNERGFEQGETLPILLNFDGLFWSERPWQTQGLRNLFSKPVDRPL